MKVLFDTNVILDLMLDRAPFAEEAERVLSLAEGGEVQGFVGATSITTIYYLATKVLGEQAARSATHKLLTIFEVAPIHREVLQNAFLLPFQDFEDAVLSEAASQVGAEAIVTRNTRDFRRSALSVYTPSDLLQKVSEPHPESGEDASTDPGIAVPES